MKLEPTGIKITEDEANAITQSMGLAATMRNPAVHLVHNTLLKLLGEKYKYDWNNVEINPLTQEVLKRCENCDEEISKEDIRIKE